jgi:metallothionein
MSIGIEQVECACPDCVCIVDVAAGVKSDGRIYCGDDCAAHHTGDEGCRHHGCECHG